MSKSKGIAPAKPITKADVARVQSVVTKHHSGQIPKGSYVGRLQAAAERNSGKSGEH